MPRIRAFEVWTKKFRPDASVFVLTGEDVFWKTEVLRELRQFLKTGDGQEADLRRLDGGSLSWQDFREEVDTPSLFSQETIIVVDDADTFVASYQKELLRLVESPGPLKVIFLLRQLSPNSKLAKAITEKGYWIDCGPAQASELIQWLPAWALHRHQVRITPSAARMLVELVGEDPGLLSQELAKLSLAVKGGKAVTPELVQEHCLSLRAKTVWVMLDLALEGKLREALEELHRLLAGGFHPLAILAQMAGSLRRLALAAELVLSGASERRALPRLLQGAGVPPSVIPKVERQISRLGLHEARRLADALLAADAQLKGASVLPERVVLESLLVRLAHPSPESPLAGVAAPVTQDAGG